MWLLHKIDSFELSHSFLTLNLVHKVSQEHFGVTPSWRANQVNFCAKRSCYTPFLQAFRADFNHVIVKMIARPKIEGSQS